MGLFGFGKKKDKVEESVLRIKDVFSEEERVYLAEQLTAAEEYQSIIALEVLFFRKYGDKAFNLFADQGTLGKAMQNPESEICDTYLDAIKEMSVKVIEGITEDSLDAVKEAFMRLLSDVKLYEENK